MIMTGMYGVLENPAMQERIDSLVATAYEFLGKDYSKPLSVEDTSRLEENGLEDCVHAIKIDNTRRIAKAIGKEIKTDAHYNELIIIFVSH